MDKEKGKLTTAIVGTTTPLLLLGAPEPASGPPASPLVFAGFGCNAHSDPEIEGECECEWSCSTAETASRGEEGDGTSNAGRDEVDEDGMKRVEVLARGGTITDAAVVGTATRPGTATVAASRVL